MQISKSKPMSIPNTRPMVNTDATARAAQPTRDVVDPREEITDLIARQRLPPPPRRSMRNTHSIQANNEMSDTRQAFKKHMELTFGLPATASLATQINHYLQENGSLDFSRDQRLINALGQKLNVYGSNAGETDDAPSWRQNLSNSLLLTLLSDVDFSVPRTAFSAQPRHNIPLGAIKRQAVSMISDALRAAPVLSGLSTDARLRLATQLTPILLPDPILYLDKTPADMIYGARQWWELRAGAQAAQDASIDLASVALADLIAVGQQALSDNLLRALARDLDVSQPPNGFTLSQLRGQPLTQARDHVIRVVRDALRQSLPPGLADDDDDDVVLQLAEELAPIVMPDPTLYLDNVEDTPDDVYYGDRQWGDLMVGVKVAQACEMDIAALSPAALIALGQQALRDELPTLAATSTEVPLSQYKALVMGIAQGKINLGPSGVKKLSAQSLAMQLEAFMATEYRHELKTVESLAELGAMPLRRQMAVEILSANRIEVEKEVKLNYRFGDRLDINYFQPAIKAYLNGDGAAVLSTLPDLDGQFKEAYDRYRDNSQRAVSELLIAQTAITLGEGKILSGSRFEIRVPSITINYNAGIENTGIDLGNALGKTFEALALTYIVKSTEANQSASRYYLFSANNIPKGLQPLPSEITNDIGLNHWIASDRQLEPLFGRAAATEIVNDISVGKEKRYPHKLAPHHRLAGNKQGSLAEAAQGAGEHHAALVEQQRSTAYDATPVQKARESLKNDFLGLIPFYDMIQAAIKGDTGGAMMNGFLDLIGFIPAIGSGIRLAGKLTATGVRVMKATASELTRGLIRNNIRSAAQAAATAFIKATPKLAKTGKQFAFDLVDNALPLGLPGFNLKLPKHPQLVRMGEALKTHYPKVAQQLHQAAAQPATQRVIKQGKIYTAAEDAVVFSDGKHLEVKHLNGASLLYPVGNIGEFENVVLKKHLGPDNQEFYTAFDPLLQKSLGERLDMVEIGFSGSSTLVLKGSTAHHLDRMMVKDLDQLQALEEVRRSVRKTHPNTMTFHLVTDGVDDEFIKMNGDWYRFQAEGKDTGRIFPENNRNLNYNNRVVYSRGEGQWQLSREAELKGGAPAAEGNQAPLQEASVQANATYKEFIDRYQEGDLVYGLGAERANYIKAKYPDYEELSIKPVTIIDEYNNILSSTLFFSHDRETRQYIRANLNAKGAKRVVVPSDLASRVMAEGSARKFKWDAYFKAAKTKPKFDLIKIYAEVAKKYGADFYHEIADNLTPPLFWKRASKQGLEMATGGSNTQIHFVLDGVDMDAVVKKTKGTGLLKEEDLTESSTSLWDIGRGEGVTASELRYIYRNWNRLQGKVDFYQGGRKVDAPWIQNHALWNQYQPHRSLKDRFLSFLLGTSDNPKAPVASVGLAG